MNKVSQVTFGVYAQAVLGEMINSASVRNGTKKIAARTVPELIREFGVVNLIDVTPNFVNMWLERFKKTRNRQSYNQYVSYISKIMNHALSAGVIDKKYSYVLPDREPKAGRVYTSDEIARITNALQLGIDNATTTHTRTLAYFAMLRFRLSFNSFMRLGEVTHLEWSRVDLSSGKITLLSKNTKTKKPRSFYVDEVTVLPLLKHVHTLTSAKQYVFYNERTGKPMIDVASSWETTKRAAGIKGKARWHDLRHTAITWALVGNDKVAFETKEMSELDRVKYMSERLMTPALVSSFAGVGINVIERVYLNCAPERTKSVGRLMSNLS